MPPAPTSTMLLAALECAEHGDLVFPVWPAVGAACACGETTCTNQGKHPLGRCAPHGLKEASRDPGVLARWWTAWPHANIGLRTGLTYTVLDVDPGKGGDVSLARLEAEHGALPQTPCVHTGGGGLHFYFEVVPGLRNSVGVVAPGLDIRGEDGYVLVPPSNHTSGNVYADDPDAPLYDTPLAPMPRWLVARAQQPSSTDGAAPGSSEEWASRLAGAPTGQRHAVAAQIAGHFLGLGIASDEVEAILLGFCARCAPPFPEAEARRIVQTSPPRTRERT